MELAEVREMLLGREAPGRPGQGAGCARSGLCAERAVRGQRTLDSDRVNVYHLRGGKIVEIWSYDSDPYALDVFWA